MAAKIKRVEISSDYFGIVAQDDIKKGEILLKEKACLIKNLKLGDEKELTFQSLKLWAEKSKLNHRVIFDLFPRSIGGAISRMSAFHTNDYYLSLERLCSTNEELQHALIGEKIYCNMFKKPLPDNTWGLRLYHKASTFNHHNFPNALADIDTDSSIMTITADKDIIKGEVFIQYSEENLTFVR